MSKVEKFVLEADEHEQLVLAIRILQHWHRGVSHYVTGVDIKGRPYLSLLWGEHRAGTPLMARLSDPDAIALQVRAWLKEADYGRAPDHDGSNTKGFRITGEGPQVFEGESSYQRRCDWDFYTFLTVQPFWNEYHK